MNDTSRPSQHVLSVMEGREVNQPVIDDLKKAATKRGWDFRQLAYLDSDQIARYDFHDTPLDYVIFRELSGNNYFETERVLHYLKTRHAIGMNLDVTGGRYCTSDKHFQQGLFLADPILRPYALPTFEAKTKANVLSCIDTGRISYPFVLKHRRGTLGNDITLIQQPQDLDQINDFSYLLIEQYVKPECDWRVFVIGGVAVGAMRKTGDPANPDDFKSWCAGFIRSTESDPTAIDQLNHIACRAAAISGLEYAGVDILRAADTGQYYLLETNIAAVWMNFVPVTGIQVPELIMDWFEDRASARSQTTDYAVSHYIKRRFKYLPTQVQENYQAILAGTDFATDQLSLSKNTLSRKLLAAYQDIVKNHINPLRYQNLIDEIESLSLSWAGNFIGPDTGTLAEGAILSALYLFILGKTREV